jgi:hypothetical protein
MADLRSPEIIYNQNNIHTIMLYIIYNKLIKLTPRGKPGFFFPDSQFHFSKMDI